MAGRRSTVAAGAERLDVVVRALRINSYWLHTEVLYI
jgi:hypothetical protein